MYAIQMGKNNDVYIKSLSNNRYDYGRKATAKKWKTKQDAELGLVLIRKINPMGAPCCRVVEL